MTIKIVETNGSYDYTDTYEILVSRDGKKLAGFHVGCVEPEDATLGRDLSFAYDAIDFFKLGYEAGKANEEVIYESIDEEEHV